MNQPQPLSAPSRHSPTFVAHIDESGDEGFKFERNSSRWFVLGAAVFRRKDELEQVKLIDEVRAEVNRVQTETGSGKRFADKQPLHFRDLKHDQRRYLSEHIAKAEAHVLGVLMDKTRLTSPENFQSGTKLYFYMVRLLIERISWLCRDSMRINDPGDGSVRLVFSNRSSLDYANLQRYLEHLEENRIAFDYNAAPGIVFPDEIETHTSGKRLGLQVADAVASSLFYAVNPNAYGMTEDAYLRILWRVLYRRQGSPWGYGIKIMPREAEEARRAGQILKGFEL
ncbi:MAG: DUF3800 domain-containing protein [Deltaproteobacteria bacterium]